jgi:hypothetical protein
MNERIKELAVQAGFHVAKAFHGIGWVWCSDDYPIDEELERFAKLVRQDYLRELKALKPVLWKHSGDGWSYEKPLFPATPLYALDEVTK